MATWTLYCHGNVHSNIALDNDSNIAMATENSIAIKNTRHSLIHPLNTKLMWQMDTYFDMANRHLYWYG